MRDANFEELVGRTIVTVIDAHKDSTCVEIVTADGYRWILDHTQDCCEDVRVEDVIGDVGDLIGGLVVLAEEAISHDGLEDYESATWTFYRLSTQRGHVDFRWLGRSNGYYSEAVYFTTDAPEPT